MAKKILSFALALATLLSLASFSAPSHAFSGIDEVEAIYFDVKPEIDGIVSAEEWGEATTYVASYDAATIFDSEPVNNRFFMRNPSAPHSFDVDSYNMYYELWLRWDEDNFYIAAKVADPDGHSLKNGRYDTWNGDAFQARIDPAGPNRGDPAYNPRTDGKPWSRTDVSNLVFGFVESAGGFSEAWDDIDDAGITPFMGGSCIISVAPCGVEYSEDTSSGITTYEIKIPWGYIDSQEHTYEYYTRRNQRGGIGKEYGMSVCAYNANGEAGDAAWNAALSWGSGIINAQHNNYSATCAGSNLVTLSGERVSESAEYSGTYENHPGGYVPELPPFSYDTVIDESRHVNLTYTSANDMNTYGNAIRGQRRRDGSNWVVAWDRDGDRLNDQNYLSTGGRYMSRGCTYTMEFDVKVTGFDTFEDGYSCTMYNWFGGSSTVDYECGYNFDTGKFAVIETKTRKVLAEKAADFDDGWHHWVFQYNKPTSEIRFYFDPPRENGRVAPYAEPMFSLTYRYFDTPGRNSCEIIFRRLNCQIMMDNVQFYNFVDFTALGPRQPTFGDADEDGELTVKDILVVRRYIAGLDTTIDRSPAGTAAKNADVNCDGEITVKDVLIMRRVIAGLDEEPKVWPNY